MVVVKLSAKGRSMEEEASFVPGKLASQLVSGVLNVDDLLRLKKGLEEIILLLSIKSNT
jgi:hypothetical protein